jgi:hypothetical protein
MTTPTESRNPPIEATAFWLALAAVAAIGAQALALWLGATPRLAVACAIGAGLGMLSVGGLCCGA